MRFDWLALLRAARAAGLTPEAFWRLTPAELRLVLGESETCGRARLEDLMRAFPDDGGQDGSRGS